MSSTVVEYAIWAMISSRERDQQHPVIIKFFQREIDGSRAQVILLRQQDHQRTETLRQEQSQFADSTRERRRESLNLEIFKYHGVDKDSLLRWLVEVDGAIESRRFEDD